jgi:phage tail-like protein
MSNPVNYLNNRFRVEVDALALDFAEVVLPDARADVVEYWEGTEIGSHKIPGAVHFGNLLLRRGVTASRDLFLWWKDIVDGMPAHRAVVVILLDQHRQPVKRWSIPRALPVRYTVSPLIASDGDSVLMETIECATEGFEVAASV